LSLAAGLFGGRRSALGGNSRSRPAGLLLTQNARARAPDERPLFGVSGPSVAIRKFARVLSMFRSELPNQSDTSNSMILVSLSTRSSQKCLLSNSANFGFGTLVHSLFYKHLARSECVSLEADPCRRQSPHLRPAIFHRSGRSMRRPISQSRLSCAQVGLTSEILPERPWPLRSILRPPKRELQRVSEPKLLSVGFH
jgi:hypothetical protein